MFSDGSKIELEFKSDVNTKTTSLANGDIIQKYGNEILDMQVTQTDMKVRHVFRKFVEVYVLQYSEFIYQKCWHGRKNTMPLWFL